MANLYDKIRKKKKENLEEVYRNLSKPKSMAESVAKFKNVNSSSAYGGGDALANPQAAIKGGANIESQAKNKAEDQGKCVQGFIVGGPNNGEECSDKPKLSTLKDKINESVSNAKERLGELTESRDDVNQDMEEGDKKLFGKQKGGSKIGNLLRSVVGESGIKKMMDPSPFKTNGPNGAKGDDALANLENDEGGGEGMGTSSGTVNIGGVQYEYDVSGDASSFDIPKGGCPKGTVEQGGKCVTVTEVDPNAGNMPDAEWTKFCQENPCNAACNKQFGQCNQEPEQNQTCAEKYGENFKEVNGKCVDITADADLKKKQEEVKVPGETSNNLTFGTQLLTNWGQNLLEGRQGRRESKDMREDKRSFTKNEQKLYNEARKSLRKSGNLPGRADQVSRQEAIYNEMNRLNRMTEVDGKMVENPSGEDGDNRNIKRDFGGQGFDVGDGKMSVGEIARDVRTGRLSYDSDDIQNLPYEVKEKIRDLSDNQGRTGTSQYSEDTSELRDVKADGEDDYQSEEEAKRALEEKKRRELEEQNSAMDKRFSKNKPANIKFGLGESIMQKKSGFKMKRGKLTRPGY